MNVAGPGFPWPYPPGHDPDLADEGIDLRAAAALLWRGKWVIAAALALALALALVAISQMQPVYTATAKMMFEDGRRNVADLEEVVRSTYDGETLQNEIEVLASNALLGNVVDALDPAPADPRIASAGDVIDWRGGAASRLLGDLGLVAPPPDAAVPMDAEARRRNGQVHAIQAGLRLTPVPRSRVVAIAYTSADPRRAARVVNEITAQYIRTRLEQRVAATRAASGWLAERIEGLRAKVAAAELAVEGARATLAAQAGQSAAITHQQIQELSGALARARAERARLDTQHAAVAAALLAYDTDFGTISLFRDAGVIRTLRGIESELVGREAALASLARDSPNRTRIKAELGLVRQAIRDEAERVVAALETDIDIVSRQEASLQGDLSVLEGIERTQRRGEVELRQLEREAEAGRVLYESFLARLQETEQQETLLAPDAFVISPAEVPTVPQGAGQKRVLVLALVLGLASGVGLTVLLDRLNNAFRSVAQVEAATGTPVLALLPAMGRRGRRVEDLRALHQWWPDGRLAEAVRNLRTSILLGGAEAAPKVVMFTSSISGEGKSTSAFLLALTSRRMGRRVVIVDADLRLRAISALVERGAAGEGLGAVLTGAASLEAAVTVDPHTGLEILAAHDVDHRGLDGEETNAADILSSPLFGALVERLGERYDLVIVDTPPVLAVTDARIVSRLADAVVFAVKWDATPREAVAKGLRELDGVKAPLAGIVLTMVSEPAACPYGEDYAEGDAAAAQAGGAAGTMRLLWRHGMRLAGKAPPLDGAADPAPHRSAAMMRGAALRPGFMAPGGGGRGVGGSSVDDLAATAPHHDGTSRHGDGTVPGGARDTGSRHGSAWDVGQARDRGAKAAGARGGAEPDVVRDGGTEPGGVRDDRAEAGSVSSTDPRRGSARDAGHARDRGAEAAGAWDHGSEPGAVGDGGAQSGGARDGGAEAGGAPERGADDWMPAPRLGQGWRSGRPRAP